MRPGDTFRATFTLTGAATGTPTAKLLRNGATETTLGTGGVITCTAGVDPYQWQVAAAIPAGYSVGDTIEFSATATVSGVTQSDVVARATVSDPWATLLPAEGEAGAYPLDSAGSFLARNQDYDGLARGGSASTITLAAGELDADARGIFLVGGTGKGQARSVVGWNSVTKEATVDPFWTTIPDATSKYLLGQSTRGYRLDLFQPLLDGKAATVGGALHGAWATAWGRIAKNLSTKILSVFGWNSQSTPAATFLLDDANSPTTRTPQ